MLRKVLLTTVVVFLAATSSLMRVACADGGKAKNAIYDGQAHPQSGNGLWQFNIDTSPIIFYLGTVNNKYHVLLIRVKNNTNQPLNLSKDGDSIELQYSGGVAVKGLLNLPAADRSTWDGLETEIRTAVAYPDVVPAHEEEGIYVYVRRSDVTTPRKEHAMPHLIRYVIKSLSAPVELRPRGVAAA